MAEFDLPVKDLEELAHLVASGKLSILRRDEVARRTKHPLDRYSSRIWLFPRGIRPQEVIEVWRNGISQYLGHEVKVMRLGDGALSVAVFAYETQPGDRIQASFTVMPSET